jgi:hypothetical protein
MKRILIVAVLVIAMPAPALAQSQCVINVKMVNHNRYAYETEEECSILHTRPWGNWGVSSNVGSKQDADQFKGWRQPCSGVKVEWNSCSTNSRYRSPSYLNFPNPSAAYPSPANGYPFSDSYLWNDTVPPHGSTYNVDQYSPCGPNTYGSFQVRLAVSPRVDTNGDGIFDAGGCKNVDGYQLLVRQNFMTVYELDTPDADDLVQSLYFPDVRVVVRCTPDACFAVGDVNYDGWVDDIYDQAGTRYKWPTLYQDNNDVVCYPSTPGVPCKRIDATIRIGGVSGYYSGP